MRVVASQTSLALERADLAEEALRRRSEARLGALVRNAPDVITVNGADGTVAYQTPSVERVFGHPADALVGRPLTDAVHEADAEAVRELLRRAAGARRETAEGAWRRARADGAWRDVELHASDLLDDDEVQGVVLTTRDVTERRGLERRLAHQAFHDALTGLPNRSLLEQRLRARLAAGAGAGPPVAVLLLDLDEFKTVNDSLGHAAGDALLQVVAQRLTGALRAGDTVARLGGDEFAVLLDDPGGLDGAVTLAARLLEVLDPPVQLHGRQVHAHASLGIALSDALPGSPATTRRAPWSCCAAPTWRCTPPRRRAATGSRSSLRACTRRRSSGSSVVPSCRGRSTGASCGCTCSPSSTSRRASSWAPRRSCAGSTRSAGCSGRGRSCRSPRRRTSSSRSAPGCSARRAGTPRRGTRPRATPTGT